MVAKTDAKHINYKVGVDCRLAGIQHAGIGRYIENLVTELLKLTKEKSEIIWVLFFYDEQQAKQVLGKLFKNKNLKIVYTPIKHYSLAEQAKLPQIFSTQNLDLLHIPHFNAPFSYPGKIVLTIHDLLWHEYRGRRVTTLSPVKYWLKYLGYRFVTYQATHKAQRIFVPTKTIKTTVSKYYPAAKHKITVTKEGVGDEFKKKTGSKILAAKSNTLLFVGSLYPHKNVRLIIDALPKLPNMVLEIAGSRDIFQASVKQYVLAKKLESRVKFLGYLSDEELVKKYQSVLALVQPSFFEGFGLTGVEAMAAGCPVLASDIPVFHEIYQDAALFFNPNQPLSLIKSVNKLQSTKSSQALIDKGKKVIQSYSWQTMAKQTLDQYLKAISSS